MNLYAIAIAMPDTEEFWFGIYFATAESELQAQQAGITFFINTHPEMEMFKDFIVKVAEVPVDQDMIPKIVDNMKGIVNDTRTTKNNCSEMSSLS